MEKANEQQTVLIRFNYTTGVCDTEENQRQETEEPAVILAAESIGIEGVDFCKQQGPAQPVNPVFLPQEPPGCIGKQSEYMDNGEKNTVIMGKHQQREFKRRAEAAQRMRGIQDDIGSIAGEETERLNPGRKVFLQRFQPAGGQGTCGKTGDNCVKGAQEIEQGKDRYADQQPFFMLPVHQNKRL